MAAQYFYIIWRSGRLRASVLSTTLVHPCTSSKDMYKKVQISGEVSEWPKEHAWKVCIRLFVSRVRIPPSPPYKQKSPTCFSGRAFLFMGVRADENPLKIMCVLPQLFACPLGICSCFALLPTSM